MRPVLIIGAGLSGLIAANVAKAKGVPFIVMERASQLPHNHHSLMRFRSSVVGDAFGIPFRKVRVIKVGSPPEEFGKDSLTYSFKSTGLSSTDRSLPMSTEIVERYVAPPDLVEQLYLPVADHVSFGADGLAEIYEDEGPVISTVPMPELKATLDYPEPLDCVRFDDRIVITANVSACDAFLTVYDANPNTLVTRASITGSQLIIESTTANEELGKAVLLRGLDLLGVSGARIFNVETQRQAYSKIAKIDEAKRKRFISWATVKHGVFSLGRFAVWKPGLLLDDVLGDAQRIVGWIKSGDLYTMTQQSVKG